MDLSSRLLRELAGGKLYSPIKSILGLKDETEPTVVAEKLKNLIQRGV